MENEDKGNEAIIPNESQALAQRSASIVRRGLRSLSERDRIIFIDLGKALALRSSFMLEHFLDTLKTKIDEFLRPSRWSLLLLDQAKQELYLKLAVGQGSEAVSDVRIKAGDGIAGIVAQTGISVVVADVRRDTRFSGSLQQVLEKEAKSVIAVPVRGGDQILGVIELINCTGPEGFPQADLSTLEAMADFTATALENDDHVGQLHRILMTDEQTGLYNARFLSVRLDAELDRSQRKGYEFSVGFVNLSELSDTSDLATTLNYASFNRLLNEIGEKLKAYGRGSDLYCRYDSGKIVCILADTTKEKCCDIARRLHKMIRETTWLEQEGLNIRLTASIGLASFPVDAKTKKDLLQLAGEALSLVKNPTRDGVAVANVGILPLL